MRKQLIIALISALSATSVSAKAFTNFEEQVFRQNPASVPLQLRELSEQEMMDTEGEVAPLVAVGILHGGRFIAQRWVTQRVAARALARGGNVWARNSQQARAVANQAWGRNNVIRHGYKERHSNYSHFQHTNQRFRGHSFYGRKYR